MKAKNLAIRVSAVALLAVPLGAARADLVLSTLTLQTGQGFGNTTTILTLSPNPANAGSEQGCFAFGGIAGAYQTGNQNLCNEGAPNDVDPPLSFPKNQIVSLNSLGITGVQQVGLVLNLVQLNNTGITLNDMNLSFYTPAGTVIFNATLPDNWCNIAALCSGPNTFLASVPGQGGSGYVFVLNAAQQAGLLAAMGGSFNGNIFVGSGGNFGCTATQGLDCKAAAAGAESISLAQITGQTSVVPEPSTAVLMATGLLGVVGFVRRRRRQG